MRAVEHGPKLGLRETRQPLGENWQPGPPQRVELPRPHSPKTVAPLTALLQRLFELPDPITDPPQERLIGVLGFDIRELARNPPLHVSDLCHELLARF